MSGEALGYLLLEGKGGFGCVRFAEEIVKWLYVPLCRAHCGETSNPLP
jgi:hypothetical protein